MALGELRTQRAQPMQRLFADVRDAAPLCVCLLTWRAATRQFRAQLRRYEELDGQQEKSGVE